MVNKDITDSFDTAETTTYPIKTQDIALYRMAYQMSENIFGELNVLSPLLVDQVAMHIYESAK